MVSFVCASCEDVMTKPKIKPHLNRCHYATFTCIDCNTYFSNNNDAFNHIQCITEAQKWHGKFAQQPGKKAMPQKKTEEKNVEEKKAEEKKAETPVKTEEKADNKRKRESEPAAEETASKKAKIDDNNNSASGEKAEVVEELKLGDFKWKKYTKKALKASEDKSLPADELKKKVVDQYLERVRSSVEAYYDAQLEKNSSIKVKKGVAKFDD